jgi:hypothetical protein
VDSTQAEIRVPNVSLAGPMKTSPFGAFDRARDIV